MGTRQPTTIELFYGSPGPMDRHGNRPTMAEFAIKLRQIGYSKRQVDMYMAGAFRQWQQHKGLAP